MLEEPDMATNNPKNDYLHPKIPEMTLFTLIFRQTRPIISSKLIYDDSKSGL